MYKNIRLQNARHGITGPNDIHHLVTIRASGFAGRVNNVAATAVAAAASLACSTTLATTEPEVSLLNQNYSIPVTVLSPRDKMLCMRVSVQQRGLLRITAVLECN